MAIDVTLCYSPADARIADAIADRLTACAEARVDRGALLSPDKIPDIWDCGLDAAGIILLLSPDSTPTRGDRGSWGALLEHVERNDMPPVACVLVRNCPVPALLKRSRFFEWDSARPVRTLRELQRWVIGLASEHDGFHPAAVPAVQSAVDSLWSQLVDANGTVLVDNTDIAQQFAHEAQDHFRQVLWIGCADRPLRFILGDIAAQLGGRESSRVLLVLNDIQADIAWARDKYPAASVLATSTSQLPATPLPRDPDAIRLSRAASVCRGEAFALDFAAEIAELNNPLPACEILVDAGMLTPLDAPKRWFRRTSQSATEATYAHKHAEVLHRIFTHWRKHPERCRHLLPEFEPAYQSSIQSAWQLAATLTGRVFDFLRQEDRIAEAIYVYDRLLQAAQMRGDDATAMHCADELSWLRNLGPVRGVWIEPEQLRLPYGVL